MSESISNQDQQVLLGIAFADQALIAAQIALFAGKTNDAKETIALLHAIADEVSNRYQLTGVAKDTMKLRMEKTIHLASAILGDKTSQSEQTAH
ncbi:MULTISPECIES: hypothetical protein [Paenalcaligenes]|uniref:Uncharacterized protein n=1 Tax=Paenalcaligenes hermetiae TaxID=1157987 RepID=A0ABP9M6P2_9BURK|nr:hypothetical protein [Paenalcaligenes sp.]